MNSPTVRSTALYTAMREYCLQVLDILRKRYPTEESLPRVTLERARVDDDRVGYGPDTELDISRLFDAPEIEDPARIPAFLAVEAAMRADEQIARHLTGHVGTPGWSYAVTVPRCLRVLRWQLIHAQKGLDFGNEHFTIIYRNVEEYFYSDAVRFRAVAGLPGFKMTANAIDLGQGLRILRLDVREREAALTNQLRFPSLDRMARDFTFGQDPFGLELIFDFPKRFGPELASKPAPRLPADVAAEQFHNVVSTLRLFKAGAVWHSVTRLRPFGWNPYPSGYITRAVPRATELGTYQLSADEMEDFRRFWPEVRRAIEDKQPRLTLALRRFEFGYERLRHEDRLIDSVIGLEALLTKPGERGTPAFQIALRGSRLLGSDASGRTEMYSTLRVAYRLRNEVVHGGAAPIDPVTVDGSSLTFAEFVERVADHLRRALREFMRRTRNLDEAHLIGALDANIIGGV